MGVDGFHEGHVHRAVHSGQQIEQQHAPPPSSPSLPASHSSIVFFGCVPRMHKRLTSFNREKILVKDTIEGPSCRRVNGGGGITGWVPIVEVHPETACNE